MERERPMGVVFFRTGTGNEPVREWLKGLPPAERHAIGEDPLAVQYAWPVGKPLVGRLGGGIWEVRTCLPTRVARTLFIVSEGNLILLHGFIKKSRPTPLQDLDLARQRQRQYESHNERQ